VRAPATTAGSTGTTIPFPHVRRLLQHRLPSHLYALRTPPLSPIFHEWVIYWFEKRCLITRVARHRSRAASQRWAPDNPWRHRPPGSPSTNGTCWRAVSSEPFAVIYTRIRAAYKSAQRYRMLIPKPRAKRASFLRDPYERYRKAKTSTSKGLETLCKMADQKIFMPTRIAYVSKRSGNRIVETELYYSHDDS